MAKKSTGDGFALFIRTELVEETQVAVVSSTDGQSTTLATGGWSGADDLHLGSGNASLVEAADGRLILSLEDFSVQDGRDPFVYSSSDPNGWNEAAVNLGRLGATGGTFSYDIPDDLDATDIASAVVWCRALGVLFATAPLTPVEA